MRWRPSSASTPRRSSSKPASPGTTSPRCEMPADLRGLATSAEHRCERPRVHVLVEASDESVVVEADHDAHVRCGLDPVRSAQGHEVLLGDDAIRDRAANVAVGRRHAGIPQPRPNPRDQRDDVTLRIVLLRTSARDAQRSSALAVLGREPGEELDRRRRRGPCRTLRHRRRRPDRISQRFIRAKTPQPRCSRVERA